MKRKIRIISEDYNNCLPFKNISRRQFRDLAWFTKEMHKLKKKNHIKYGRIKQSNKTK